MDRMECGTVEHTNVLFPDHVFEITTTDILEIGQSVYRVYFSFLHVSQVAEQLDCSFPEQYL